MFDFFAGYVLSSFGIDKVDNALATFGNYWLISIGNTLARFVRVHCLRFYGDLVKTLLRDDVFPRTCDFSTLISVADVLFLFGVNQCIPTKMTVRTVR